MIHKRQRMTVVEKLVVVAVVLLFAAVLSYPVTVADTEPIRIAAPPRGLTVDADVVRIVDGDTIDVEVAFRFRVRLLDCWSPETRTLDRAEKIRGLAAKGYMLELADGARVRVHIPGSDNLADMLTLDRALGRVWLIRDDGNPDNTDLSQKMVEAGHAKPKRPETDE